MLLEDRSRTHRADFELQAVSHGPCLSTLWYNTNHTSRLKNLSNRHRDGPARYFIKTAEPSLAYLLIATLFVEFDYKIWRLSLEISGRIIKSEVPVLPNANESYINCMARNQLTDSPAFSRRIRRVAVDEVESSGLHAIHDSLPQVSPETGAVPFRQTNILVKMKESRLSPVYIWLPHQRLEKFELRGTGGPS